MNILYHPQISMRSRATDRLITDHDAQWVKVKEVIEWLDDEAHNVTILLSHSAEVPELVRSRRQSINVNFIAGHGNVLKNRYHFDSKRTMIALDAFCPDVIWLEVPELVANYKSLTNTPIVATFEHFLDDLFWRQFEGFMTADMRVIPTHELYDVFDEMAEDRLTHYWLERFQELGYTTWGNFVAEKDLLSIKETVDRKLNSLPRPSTAGINVRVLFPSRLTDFARTKWAFFLNAIENLLEEGYTVEICNPSEVEKPTIIREMEAAKNGENLVFHETKMSREEWLLTIAQTDVAMMLYSFDQFYSVGAVEMLAAGVKLVTIESLALDAIAEYGQLYYMRDLNEKCLTDAVNRAIKGEFHHFSMRRILDKTSGAAWASKMFETLEKAANMRT